MKFVVSIVLPFCNSEKTLANSIESILDQSYEKFELLLINTNSTDNSDKIAEKYVSDDSRIQCINVANKGIAAALNTGIAAAKGQYIAIMDADDICLPERIDKQYKFLEKNKKYDLVACCVDYVNDDAMQFGLFEYVKWNNRIITFNDICLNRFIESPIVYSTAMFRKKLSEKYTIFREGDFPGDYELWLRLIDAGVKMCKLPEVLIRWKDSPDRLNRTDRQFTSQAFFEIKSYYLYNWLKANNPYHPRIAVWGAGRTARQRFSLLRDLGVEPKFFIDIRANPTYNVIEYTRTPPAGRNFIVSYISNPEAREKIREFLVSIGYTEGKDFICIA